MHLAIVNDKKAPELKKHVGLIHSTNKLSLLERKIANALLYNAYDDLQTRAEHNIHIPSLCQLIGYNSNDYKTVKKSLISLISTVLEWNIIDRHKKGEEGIWMASAMLSDAKIEGPICTYSYSNRMRELCYHPEFYGRLNMNVLSMFKSTYGLALYENCIRYQTISQTPWFDLMTYRKLMGVGEGKYVIFRDLNRRVINPSVKEVNEYSPIRVEPVFKKQGREVIAIQFLISKIKGRNSIPNKLGNVSELLSLHERLKGTYGFSEKQIACICASYKEPYIVEKMSLIENSSSYQSGKIKNVANYFEKALKEDYQQAKSSQTVVEKNQQVKKMRDDKIHEFKDYQNKQLSLLFEQSSAEEKNRIEKAFERYISPTLYEVEFARHGFNSALIKDRFKDYLRSHCPNLVSKLSSFDDFCKGIVNDYDK